MFDAYRVEGHPEEVINYHNIYMVYTKEAQTADHYIEKFAYDNQKKYHITVATSDGLQQIIIRGSGCDLLSARELQLEIERANKSIQQTYQEMQVPDQHYLIDALSEKARQKMDELLKEENGKG